MEKFEIPQEMPDKKEQVRTLSEKIGVLEEEKSKFHLPENLPDGEKYLPEHLDSQQKSEILRIQRELNDAKTRLNFLENPDK